MEVVSGFIRGLDTDTPETADFILEFPRTSNIPLLTINLIQALPGTPLFDRLQREGRLVDDNGRGSNVLFKMPYEDVIANWKRCMKAAFEPEKLFERYRYQAEHVFPKRLHPPLSRAQLNWPVIKSAFRMLGRIVWRLGVVGDYKRVFWKYALPRLAKLDIEGVIAAALVGHHLIMYARDASGGAALASNYSAALREASVPAE